MPKVNKFPKANHKDRIVRRSGGSLIISIHDVFVKRLKIDLNEEVKPSVNGLDDPQEGNLWVKFFRKEED